MNNLVKKHIAVFFFCVTVLAVQANKTFSYGDWTLIYNSQNTQVNIQYKQKPVLSGVEAQAKSDQVLISSNTYSKTKFQTSPLKDSFGEGLLVTIVHISKEQPLMKRHFYLYNTAYLFADVTLEATGETMISSNYLAPICLKSNQPLGGSDFRALKIPFDNDMWIRYSSAACKDTILSYEVTSVYSPSSKNGLILGSLEHNTWKSAIRLVGEGQSSVKELCCFSGVADKTTRDLLKHGAVSGKSVSSAKMMLGVYQDWREGLEAYATNCARIAPARSWKGGVPFGWNSWGKMQFKMTFDKVLQVSDFFKENIQENNFNNDSIVYIGMDSGWNSMTDEQLAEIVRHCRANGQEAGIYFTPFTDWGKRKNHLVDGAPEYKYSDIYLYANGEPQELDGAWAVDPTHPAVKKRIDLYIDKFKKAGFKYLKIDFLTHGAMESDAHYDSTVTTGIQAYNQGMDYLKKKTEGMYVTMAISPLFPSQYAHSRRIACDAFGHMKDSEYTLNAVSFGWWLDKVYAFNDPDHLVMEGATEGENRARVTSGVVTGIYMIGDDLSASGELEAKEKVKKFLTNPEINDIARIPFSFRPLRGDTENSDNKFYLSNDKEVYLVVFNYSESTLNETIAMNELGLDANSGFQAKELWSGEAFILEKEMNCTVPAKDVKVFKIVR